MGKNKKGIWGIMWYEQGSSNESTKTGFTSREAAEAWGRTKPSIMHRFSHAMVYTKDISHTFRRAEVVDPKAVAVAFSKVLKSWLTNDQMVKVLMLNRKEKDQLVCHSHDFCDANMAMDAAIKKVAPAFYKAAWADNRKTDGEGKVWSKMNTIWNRAWSIAKTNYFFVER